ncbi:MAG: 3-keto-5-aminohexanoate cleavage protein [Myxococcales bacterium]|nr:3-keto-5-aminohexanoate cleavage protein [Myxococcales bacterium]
MAARSSDAPVVIEVALNGATRPEVNPNAPQTQERLVEDALACIEAGASIVHTHAPDITKGGREGAELYLAHFRPVLERHPDVVLYPTLVFAAAIEEKTSHIPFLAEAMRLRMGFVDPGSLNLGPTDDDGVPSPMGIVYANSFGDIAYKLALCERLGLGPGMAIFEPGFLRAAMAYAKAGRMPRGAFLRFYLGGAASYRGAGRTDLLFGLPATPASVDTYVDMLEAEGLAIPWSVAVVSGNTLDGGVAERALERGGHLRVGLEDYAGAHRASNVELVREAAARVRAAGRRVARPDEVGSLLDLPR